LEIQKESKDDKTKRNKSRSLKIATTGILAGVYTVATIALGTLSYGPLNLRFTNILIGVVPIVGWPSVLGLTLGVFLSNTTSPLGPIDLISALFSFVGLVSIYLLRKKSVAAGLAIYSLILSVWVTFELHVAIGLPYEGFYAVLAGISVVLALAYLFYRALKASHLLRRFDALNA
jgi:hypothetical protein